MRPFGGGSSLLAAAPAFALALAAPEPVTLLLFDAGILGPWVSGRNRDPGCEE
jgi:hypothetical protein